MADKIEKLRLNEKGELDLCKPIEELFNENLAKTLMGAENRGTDNMTAVVIYFHDNLKVLNKEFETFEAKIRGVANLENGDASDMERCLCEELQQIARSSIVLLQASR